MSDRDGREVENEDAREDESPDDGFTTMAEEPIEDRLRRAYANGFADGLQRGAWGRFDHS